MAGILTGLAPLAPPESRPAHGSAPRLGALRRGGTVFTDHLGTVFPDHLHVRRPAPPIRELGRVLRDPETPPGQSTLALRALVNPPVPQVVWYVDGAPFQVADYPYTVRWKLLAGEHVFRARLIDGRTASSAVRVLVQWSETRAR